MVQYKKDVASAIENPISHLLTVSYLTYFTYIDDVPRSFIDGLGSLGDGSSADRLPTMSGQE
jgi:hypothetical protein